MSIINRWGTEEAQKAYFKRQIEYRKTTMDLMSHPKGAQTVADNSMAFKMTNQVETKEQMIDMIMSRYLAPILKKDDYVLPQIIGVNTVKTECYIYSYAPILKEFNGKVAGLVDALMAILGTKECDLYAFVSGTRDTEMGQYATVAAYNVGEKEALTRAFMFRNGSIVEFSMPMATYEEIFSRTFDSDIWTEEEVWDAESL